MANYIVHSTVRRVGLQVLNKTGIHSYLVDEPVVGGGTDAGPNPVQFLLGAIGSCMSVTAKEIADKRDDLDLKSFKADVSGETEHYQDGSSKVVGISIKLTTATNLDADGQQAFLDDVVHKCTVHATLAPGVPMQIIYAD